MTEQNGPLDRCGSVDGRIIYAVCNRESNHSGKHRETSYSKDNGERWIEWNNAPPAAPIEPTLAEMLADEHERGYNRGRAETLAAIEAARNLRAR